MRNETRHRPKVASNRRDVSASGKGQGHSPFLLQAININLGGVSTNYCMQEMNESASTFNSFRRVRSLLDLRGPQPTAIATDSVTRYIRQHTNIRESSLPPERACAHLILLLDLLLLLRGEVVLNVEPE